LTIQSKVRIAEELIRKVMVPTLMAIGLMLSVKGSLSVSFDAIVYDKHKPHETVVTSYLNSRERQQSLTEMLKNVKVLKNLQDSEKTVNLSKMQRPDLPKVTEVETLDNNAILNARPIRLRISLKCAFDIRLTIQSKVRIAEELIRKVMVPTLIAIGLMLSVKGSLS